MIYSIEEIKDDIKNLTEKEFYTKHIIRSDNWYFEKYLGKNSDELIHLIDDYRLIVSECFEISVNSVIMVGSGKLGVSITPPYNNDSKFLLPFNDDEKERKISDLDIAIISSDIFHEYWDQFRKSYKIRFQHTYLRLYNELYRGYINEKRIMEVDDCRRQWKKKAYLSNKKLRENLYFKHDISYRIYRSWEDFEDYNIQNIRKIKKEKI